MHWTAWLGVVSLLMLGLVALRLLNFDDAPKIYKCNPKDYNDAILVAVVSNDDELDVGETLASLFGQALCPQRVRVVVATANPMAARLAFTTAATANALPHHAHHAQVLYHHTHDVSAALRLANRNEPWCVVTSTRTRFPTLWDELLLDQIRKLPARGVLSSPLAEPLFGSQMPTDPPPFLYLAGVEGNHLRLEAHPLREMPLNNIPVPQVGVTSRYLAGPTNVLLRVTQAHNSTALTQNLLAQQFFPYAPGTHIAFSTSPPTSSTIPEHPATWSAEELQRFRHWAKSQTRTIADTDYTSTLKQIS